MTMNGPLAPGYLVLVTAVNRESARCSLFHFCALFFRRMCQECFHRPLSMCFCYCLLHILTGSLQTSWRGPGAVCVGAGPSAPPCFPSCLFMLPREPRAGLRTGPGGQVPVLDTGAVPWGRDTASWAATEVSCKTLDALEPGQCRSWCTCHRRVCWHGLARRGILVGLCRASLPASCSSGFWFLWQLGFQDLGKSGLGGVRVVLEG